MLRWDWMCERRMEGTPGKGSWGRSRRMQGEPSDGDASLALLEERQKGTEVQRKSWAVAWL